jgi:4-hydroxy-2-oxoheptanedioate aldolase
MKQYNKFKQVLDEGKVALGTCIDSFSPAVVEVAGYSGLDFVRIDTEYSWRRDDTLEHMVRAAVIAGITPMIRVEKHNPYLISKALQIGAGSILVSDISTVEEAEAVVKASKFAPRGSRGCSSFSFSAGWGTQGGKDWIDWSNTQIPIGIMVENTNIVEKLDEIFSIDGLDYCLFGPADYSMSLGLGEPQKGHPDVQKGLEKTIASATRYGKIVGIPIGKPWKKEAEKYIDMGCRFLEIGHELGILSSEWKSSSSEIRKGS